MGSYVRCPILLPLPRLFAPALRTAPPLACTPGRATTIKFVLYPRAAVCSGCRDGEDRSEEQVDPPDQIPSLTVFVYCPRDLWVAFMKHLERHVKANIVKMGNGVRLQPGT